MVFLGIIASFLCVDCLLTIICPSFSSFLGPKRSKVKEGELCVTRIS